MAIPHAVAVTKYYLQSLIDADRIGPDDSDILSALRIPGEKKAKETGEMLPVALHCWKRGKLDAQSAGVVSKYTRGSNSIDAVLFPKIGLLKQVNGRYPHHHRVLIPLAVFVSVDANGHLTPSGAPPLIPRKWLDPAGSIDSGQTPIGSLDAVDEFCSKQPFEAVTNWGELYAYCEALLQHVSGTNDVVKASREYTASSDALLLLEPPISGTTGRIQGVLNDILNGGNPSQLYQNLISHKDLPTTDQLDVSIQHSIAIEHIAQMTGEFPLSDNQRTALAHFIEDKRDGEILAVNGPPGTGKTTLLRSVVSNLWVQAALKGDDAEPPIIVAASNNNQAVTNILESFGRIDEKGMSEDLKMRWLPGVDSYGLYHCSEKKAAEAQKAGYSYIDSSGNGSFGSLQSQEYIDKAEPGFLSKASTWANKSIVSVDKAKNALHKALKDTVSEIKSGHTLLCKYEDMKLSYEAEQRKYLQTTSEYEAYIVHAEAGLNRLIVEFADTEQQLENATEEMDSNISLQNEFDQLVSERSLLLDFFIWFPPIRKKVESRNRLFLNKYKIDCQGQDDLSIIDELKRMVDQSKETVIFQKGLRADAARRKAKHEAEISRRKDEQKKLKKRLDARNQALKKTISDVTGWLGKYGVASPNLKEPRLDVEAVCDCQLRFKAFKLATHYWEARWLIETREFLSDKTVQDSKSPKRLEAKWRRFAKLMPCFVSTFYMAPNGFVGWSKSKGGWKPQPMYGAIDLLIVDESGQANPEIGSATFALAERAVVVGDTDQIEPVWSIPATIDKANLKLAGLLKCDDEFENVWEKSGLLASNGNVMRAAQRRCRFHQYPKLQQGLYLTEHRRCYNDIVEYCNDLVYEGELQALRGNPKAGQEPPWPLMGFIHSDGESLTAGGSRYNPAQAKDIANWLAAQKETLIAYAHSQNASLQSTDQDIVLGKTVGIVTPFKRQEQEIRRALKSAGFPDITVGTVHKLQGDERLLLLFSSVYGGNDSSSGKFYDSSPNMLNVAVSRAKDSFIVFGHKDVFGNGGLSTPSGLLKSRLTSILQRTLAARSCQVTGEINLQPAVN